MTEIGVSSIAAYAAQSDYSKNTKNKTMKDTTSAAGTAGTSEAKQTKGATGNYGRTIGQPELSEKAAKYYEQLKKKYGNYDFILVSRDQKENAKANAAKYANGYKTVVLIDEDKIEQKSSAEQKARIEKKAEQKKTEKKAAEKKAAKKEKEEQLKEKRAESDDTEETVTITANSIEELLSRIDTYNFNTRSDEVQTQSERQVGQNIDFRG